MEPDCAMNFEFTEEQKLFRDAVWNLERVADARKLRPLLRA